MNETAKKYIYLLWYVWNWLLYIQAGLLASVPMMFLFAGSMSDQMFATLLLVFFMGGELLGVLLLVGRIVVWTKRHKLAPPPGFAGLGLKLSVLLAIIFLVAGAVTAFAWFAVMFVIYVAAVFVLMCFIEWPDLYRVLRKGEY